MSLKAYFGRRCVRICEDSADRDVSAVYEKGAEEEDDDWEGS